MRIKSENPSFEISYSVVAPHGGAEKSLNMDALQTIAYIKPPKVFKTLHDLIAFRLAQLVALPYAFWYHFHGIM